MVNLIKGLERVLIYTKKSYKSINHSNAYSRNTILS